MRRPDPARNPFVALPSRRTAAVVGLAMLCGASVWSITSRAADAADALGTTVAVWVAEADLDPGDVIDPGDVVAADRPLTFVPDDALGEDPVGLTVRSAVAEGEVVVASRVAEHGSGPAALIPSGWRGVAVTTFDPPPPVDAGSLVDVVVADVGDGVLVDDAVVIHVDESGSTVTVAVPRAAVPALAMAQSAGAVTLTLAG